MTILRERAEQFETHYSLALSIEDQIVGGEQLSIGSTQLSVRHLLTMKSGLMVHLYNIVESVMSQIRKMLGTAFGAAPPSSWSASARKEWLRAHGAFGTEGHINDRMKTVDRFSLLLIAGTPPKTKHIAKPKGNWHDELIGEFAKWFGIDIPMEEDLHRKMANRPELGGKSPLKFLADRRNDLAHGDRSFEDAEDLTLVRIREIADVAFEFLQLVVNRFQNYVEQKLYLTVP
ncbi:MAE_28990/MAE_18760 family HEPN-like nuclease [Methylobacterium sp. CM6247]